MRTLFKKWLVIPALLALLFAPEQASADLTLGFYGIRNQGFNEADVVIGEAQLSVTISDAGSEQVDFTFRNVGSGASSITDVYFDDGTLLGIATIFNSSGVSFSQGASPGNLSGGNEVNPPFVASAGFMADSDNPVFHHGVNNTLDDTEYVTIRFDLINGRTYDDVIAALVLGGYDGANPDALRIGIRVQGFDGGGSESFINNPPNPIPVPPGIVLMAIGSVGVFGFRRFRSRQSA